MDSTRYPLLSGIDPYGDTVFNTLQVRRLRVELASYRSECDASAEFFEALDQLCLEVEKRVHLFLWFIGD